MKRKTLITVMLVALLGLVACDNAATNPDICVGGDDPACLSPGPQPMKVKLPWTEAACGEQGGKWLNGECWWLGDEHNGLVMGASDETTKSETAYITRSESGVQRTKQAYLTVSYLATKPHAEYEDMKLPHIIFSVPLVMDGNDSAKLAKRYPYGDIDLDFVDGADVAGVKVEAKVVPDEGVATLVNSETLFSGIGSGKACYSGSYEEALKNDAVGDFSGSLSLAGKLVVKVYSKASPDAALNLTEFSVPMKFDRKFDLKVLPSVYGMCACSGGAC